MLTLHRFEHYWGVPGANPTAWPSASRMVSATHTKPSVQPGKVARASTTARLP